MLNGQGLCSTDWVYAQRGGFMLNGIRSGDDDAQRIEVEGQMRKVFVPDRQMPSRMHVR